MYDDTVEDITKILTPALENLQKLEKSIIELEKSIEKI